MGNISKKDRAAILEHQTRSIKNLSATTVMALKLLLEESLYIALMVDLWLVSGHVKVWQDPGHTQKTLMAIQRELMADTLHGVGDAVDMGIPFTDIKPVGWMAPYVRAWEAHLRDADTVDGEPYYKKMPMQIRIVMVLMLPGILRVMIQLTRQIIQVAKP